MDDNKEIGIALANNRLALIEANSTLASCIVGAVAS
jgi:hypothetical protein